ncbi:MAG: polyphosphate kinase 1, partial [Planctomycetota bacterium]
FDSIWEAIADHDVLLNHPYESFESVVKLIQEAADDPDVLAIKQTLYRTSGDSPIIEALQNAAENGKEVTVLVELKARFDEARNVGWARRLEDAGCHVIYGIVGLKTHAKALLIVRRQNGRIQRYVHLATGNYNDSTAKLYSDIGLFTCDFQLASDVSAFFNLLTGFSETVGWSKLAIAPTGMRKRFIELINREIKASSADRPGLIMVKVNSLEDPEICQALYRASRKGVKILLNIRGICCLKPGVKGISENIKVVSILDRYLEHARVFYFSNGGHPEVYLSSADWMGRNLDKRFELLFPVSGKKHQKRIKAMLDVCFADNTQSWKLLPDGSYEAICASKKKVLAQQVFYEEAFAATQQQKRQKTQRFRPVRQKRKS